MTSAAEPSGDTPTYPLLRPFTPVLRRSPDEVQIGFGGDTALIVLTTEPIEQIIALLDGRRRRHDIYRRARRLGLTPDRVDAWIRLLADNDLLIAGADADQSTRPLTGRIIKMVGAGLLAKTLAVELVALGVSTLHLSDDRPVDPQLYPTSGAVGSMGEALGALLTGGDRSASIHVSTHWSKPEGIRPDVTVVACDAPEPDRVIAFHLLADNQPHLFLRTLGPGVVVGPLVVPGQTACLHCTDLTRTERDGRWPVLLQQLSRLTMSPLPATARWAAAVAVPQILGLLQGQAPQALSTTLEMTPPDYALTTRQWPQHPGCGCGWTVNAE